MEKVITYVCGGCGKPHRKQKQAENCELSHQNNEIDPDTIYKAYGRVLATYRKNCGINQAQLASRIGLTRTSVANIEKGRQHISLHQLINIARACGKNADDMLRDTEAHIRLYQIYEVAYE